jgi:hypothetical protein
MATTYTALSFRTRSLGNDPNLFINLLLLAVTAAMALPAGTAAFSRLFKEQQILFFHSLPLSRVHQWLLVTGGSFAAVVSSFVILAILRPGALMYLIRTETLPEYAAFVLISFAAGACFALVFMHPVAVYASAYFGTLIITGLTARTLLAPFSTTLSVRELRAGQFPTLEGDRALWASGVLIVLLTVVLLVLSLRFYIRGELPIFRSQLRNLATVSVAALVFIFVVTPLALMAFTTQARRYFRHAVIISPDGRYAAAMYSISQWTSAQRIIETKSGRTIRTIETGSDSDWRFTEAGQAVDISRVVPRIRYGHRETRVSLYSDDGTPIATTRFPGEDVKDVGSPDTLAFATTDGSIGRIVQWDGGTPRELVRAPIDGTLTTARGLVTFHNVNLPSHVWRVHNGTLTELPFVRAATKEASPVVVISGVAYTTEETATRLITRDAPLPAGNPQTVTWHLSPAGWETRFVYVSIDRSLYRLDAAAKRWIQIGVDIPLVFSGPQGNWRRDVGTDLTSTAVAFLKEAADGTLTLRLYDGATGRTIDVDHTAHPKDDPFVTWKGQLLQFSSHSPTSVSWTTIGKYWYEGGIARRVSSQEEGNQFRIGPDGTQVWYAFPTTLVVIEPNGTMRRIPL